MNLPNKSTIRLILTLLVLVADIVAVSYAAEKLGLISLSSLSSFGQTSFILILLITTSILSVFAYSRFFSSGAPIAHNVAIVGFPKSGKTTLIITLFGEIFARRIKNIDATLKTPTTIERVNEYLNKLQKGLSVGPTTDQDIFAYRTNIEQKTSLFSQSYKVEFGDFPGEDSEEYIKNYGLWLHTTPFFQWMTSADVVIFVIDIGKYLNPIARVNYIADMSAAIRAAWQHIISSADEGADAAKSRKVILVFTKSDLFGLDLSGHVVDEVNQQLLAFGFGSEIPPIKEINATAFLDGKDIITRDFADLIAYLENETKSFSIVFTSSFATLGGERLGASELLHATLPRRSTFF